MLWFVGAYWDDDTGAESGVAFVYRWNDTTSEYDEYKLTASNGAADGGHFGVKVGVSGDNVVVGARYNDGNVAASGSAYVYKWNGSAYVENPVIRV